MIFVLYQQWSAWTVTNAEFKLNAERLRHREIRYKHHFPSLYWDSSRDKSKYDVVRKNPGVFHESLMPRDNNKIVKMSSIIANTHNDAGVTVVYLEPLLLWYFGDEYNRHAAKLSRLQVNALWNLIIGLMHMLRALHDNILNLLSQLILQVTTVDQIQREETV